MAIGSLYESPVAARCAWPVAHLSIGTRSVVIRVPAIRACPVDAIHSRSRRADRIVSRRSCRSIHMFAAPGNPVDPRNSNQACAWQACYRFSLHDTPLRSRLLWILDGRTSRFGSGTGDWESNGALGVSRDEQREVVGMRKVGSLPERVMRLHMNSAQASALSEGSPGTSPTN